MKKVYIMLVFMMVVVLLVSCGTPSNVNQRHIDSLSNLPRFLIDKSNETGNNATLFSFDMNAIRGSIPYDESQPHSAIINTFGVVPSRYYGTNEEHGILNPNKVELLASCPYWDVQAFYPAGNARQNLSDAGYIEEIIGNGYLLTKKYDNNIEAELAPVNCFIEDSIIQVTTTANYQGEKIKSMLMGNDERVSDYSVISEVLNYLPAVQAVAVVFSHESYEEKGASGAINTELFDRYQQADMIPQFGLWGRPKEYIVGAVGSNVIDGVEHTTIALLYGDENTAREDLVSLKSAVSSLPSMVTGRSWMEYMKFGKPIIKQNGRAVIIDFDIEGRNDDDGLLSMQMLKLMDQSGDWGLFWRK